MEAILITIGDEILSGTTVDTNSNFIAAQLKEIGIKVVQIITISDEVDVICYHLENSLKSVDLVISTGGLGPTKDDKTKKAFAKYFNDELVLDDETFLHLRNFAAKRNRLDLLERNKEQAMILSRAQVFQNFNGTAPCLMMTENKKIAICLPGVPYEVKPLIKDQIIPFLRENYNHNFIISRTFSVINFAESLLSDVLEDWELALPKNCSLSYLPIANRVKLKLTATGHNKEDLYSILDVEFQKIKPLLNNKIISENGDTIEEILQDVLLKHNLQIAVAESCTGGEIAHLMTSVSGSSAYFLGGIVAYDYHKKIEILGVSINTIKEKTVVSKEVAQEMSLGCQKLFKTAVSVATTGVAGPNTDAFNSEIGSVYYSIRVHDFEKTFALFLPHLERKDFMNFVAMKVLQDLVDIIINEKWNEK